MNLLKSLDYQKMSKDRISAVTEKLIDGGEGSGNFGHKGRPGQIGGSGGGGSVAKATTKTQSEHKSAIVKLSDKSYNDGTYDVSTLKPVDFKDGFQVTFCQIGDDYSDEEYSKLVNEFYDLSTDRKTYAGKFGGAPEVSFHFANREDAVRMAKKYNQISVWDWSMMDEITTGGTGRRN